MQPQTLPPSRDWQAPPTYTGANTLAEPNLESDYAGPQQWSSTYQEDTVDWPLKKSARQAAQDGKLDGKLVRLKPKSIVLGLATLVIFLLLLIPSWNCIGLLEDPVFTYMVGSNLTGWLLTFCVVFFLSCYITLLVVLNSSRPEVRSEQSMLMIAGIFLSTLGIMLILFGGPLDGRAAMARKEFSNINCKIGAKTSQLYIVAQELESLRAMPNCANLTSVEDCSGFALYPKMKEAMVLKAMESEYMCSGLCQGTNAKGEQIYPPTLFSLADYKTSCDGMAARHLRNFAEAIGQQTCAEGIMLVLTAIVISFGQLFAFCSGDAQGNEARSGKSYGATL